MSKTKKKKYKKKKKKSNKNHGWKIYSKEFLVLKLNAFSVRLLQKQKSHFLILVQIQNIIHQ